MAHRLESETMDLLASTVEDEKKTVTYRWLSRSMGYSVNVAKQFMETYLTNAGRNKVHATYYLSRLDPSTGNKTILLVNQEDLKAATKDTSVVSHHIYSLEPSPLKDRSLLSVSNAEATKMQKGKDINIYRIVLNRDVTISKSTNRGSAATLAPPKSNSAFAAKPTAPAAKPEAPVVSLSPSSAAPAPVANAPASAPSTAAASKSKAPAKNSMMTFFGKAGAAKPAPSATNTNKPALAASKSSVTNNSNNLSLSQKRKADSMSNNNQPRSTPQVSDDDDDEFDSEEERDRRLALSSRLDQDQGPVTKSATVSKPVDLAAAKKRQRSAKLLAVDDDDEEEDSHVPKDVDEDEDEDVKVLSKEARHALEKEKDAQRLALENMMLMDDHHTVDEDEDSMMIDVEAVDSVPPPAAPVMVPSSVVTSSVSNGNGTITRRVRGHRAVTKKKTSVNERGYMVTESMVVMEPFSEDEIIEETPAPAPAAIISTPAARVEPAPKGATGGPKKKAGGNQSLLNFFSKK
ncbi:DNA polymerase delta subunit 3 [Podila epicladia]|nr:DNA polymerase delta subunit 3 [Podila epicladia]KAG0096219.1 DNA polymerase delta subunit 3 [Podila epicladia]